MSSVDSPDGAPEFRQPKSSGWRRYAFAAVGAAVLICRFLTVVPTLVLGGLAASTWRFHRSVPEGNTADPRNEVGVQEQSHKTEMRAALRGDFERLRVRRENGGEAEAVSDPVVVSPAANAPVVAPEIRPSWLDRLRGRR